MTYTYFIYFLNFSFTKNNDSYHKKSLELAHKTPEESKPHNDKANFDKTDSKEIAERKSHTTTNTGNEQSQIDATPVSRDEIISPLPPLPAALDVPTRKKGRRMSTDERIEKLEKVLQQHNDESEIRQRPKTRGAGDRPKTSQSKYRRRQSEFGLSREHVGTATELIIQGKVDIECPSTAKIVRIFTSSTFTGNRI